MIRRLLLLAGTTLIAAVALGETNAPTAQAEVTGTVAVWCGFIDAIADCEAGVSAADVQAYADALGDADGWLQASDFVDVDLDANQITDGSVNLWGQILIFAFVDDDGMVAFDAGAGVSVQVFADDGGAMTNTDANDETCDDDGTNDEPDCSTWTMDDGDGVVVARITDGTATAGDEVDVLISQADNASVASLETLTVVGAADNLALTATEPVIGTSGNSWEYFDCLDGSDATNPDQVNEPDRTFLVVTMTDNDDVSLTRIPVNLFVNNNDIADVGDDTIVTVDHGGAGIALFGVVCGGSIGTATFSAEELEYSGEVDSVSVKVVGPPATILASATPSTILCDLSETTQLSVTIKDKNGDPVADGIPVSFFVFLVGIVSPINTVTAGGSASSTFYGISGSTIGVPVYIYAGDATASVLITCQGFDTDGDGLPNVFETANLCLNRNNPDSHLDPDLDALSSLAEYGMNTSPCAADTDDDGCSDGAEVGGNPVFGGDRDPLSIWDFYDVNGDQRIDLNDTLDILARFGLSSGDPGYDPAFDRDAPDPAKPWRTAADTSGNGIDLTDALVNLASFGHDCSGPP